MIDIGKIKYRLVITTSEGKQIDTTPVITDMGWEEGESELATRLSFSAYDGDNVSSISKLGCVASIIIEWGADSVEVARGSIVEWHRKQGVQGITFDAVAYDELFNLQESQDNRYYSAGTGTKAAITSIFNDWGIPVERYDGPNVSHAKKIFKNDFLSDILLELLEDAAKKGGPKCIIRASKGKVSVIPKGSNSTVYQFDEDTNITLVSDKISTADMVTRVKVVGKEDSDERQPVEAILNGQIEYGIRQRIYTRANDDSLATAKSDAQDILDERGKPEKTITVSSPDVPFIRKGDRVHVKAGTLNGYFYVQAIRHNARERSMSMDLEPDPASGNTDAASFSKGDRVILNGAVYIDSYGNGRGRTFTNLSCTITIKVDTSRPCPYHLDGIGWVYQNTITKA